METIYKEQANKAGIYKIYNKINNRFYIGSAKLFKVRCNQHIKSLRKNKHSNKFLQNDFNKCGEENFVFEVLEVIEGNKLDRTKREKEILDQCYDKQKLCYNIRKQTVENDPKTFSNPQERNKKISESSKRMWQNPEYKKYMSESMKKIWEDSEYKENFIKKIKQNYENNPELKQKLSDHFKKLWQNPEHRELIKQSREEFWSNPENVLKYSERMKCFKHTKETKEKLREINLNKEVSEEIKNKIKNSVKKLWQNEEYRKLQTENKIGKTHSQETKDKLKIIINKRKETISNDIKNLWKNNQEYRQKMVSKIKARCCKRIKCVDIITNQETIFESTAEAARVLKISKSNIADVLKNRIKLTNKKYKFEYVNE